MAEEAKYKDKGIEDISEGIKDGTISFKESAKEQDETSYEWYVENNSQEGDLVGAIYEGIAEFLNGLDDAERAEVFYDLLMATSFITPNL